jgi:DNA-binding transcriptional MerR regulator
MTIVADNGYAQAHLRIGELSRRVGVTPEVLRAWERRYGLLAPVRTAGGFRLYGEEDERRILRMLDHLASGVSAAEAARLAQLEAPAAGSARNDAPLPAAGRGQPVPGEPTIRTLGERLRSALDEFNDVGAHAVLDRLLGAYPLDAVLGEAVLPYLHDLGARWQRGEATVAQEHFASALLRGRLLALARGWGSGRGPQALLACLPGDQHDLGLDRKSVV